MLRLLVLAALHHYLIKVRALAWHKCIVLLLLSLLADLFILLMLLELRRTIKLCSTIVTLEWSVVDMSFDMIYQMAFSDELLGTKFAFKVPFPIVTS